jgi:alcohol dehydrogenase class IV
MDHFEFATATRIIFGQGAVADAGKLAAEFGWRALVVTGLELERSRSLLQALAIAQLAPTLLSVSGEPTLDFIAQGVDLCRRQECDVVIGFGGGSAIDAAKAIAALATNDGETLDYLEVVGRGQTLLQAPLPFIAIPTTAGTGSEVTRNAVISVPDERVKVSLRSARMLPRIALVDPELTYGLPPEITASTGMDALTQLIEPLVCNRPTPIVDALARDGIARAAWALPRAYSNGADAEARQAMALVSLFGGLALANAKLGAVHGFAAVIGGMYPAPHGAVCARLLPLVVAENLRALRQREPENPALQRYEQAARLLTGDAAAAPEDGAGWLEVLGVSLAIPPLSRYGVMAEALGEIVSKAERASSMQGNPIHLTTAELTAILERAL